MYGGVSAEYGVVLKSRRQLIEHHGLVRSFDRWCATPGKTLDTVGTRPGAATSLEHLARFGGLQASVGLAGPLTVAQHSTGPLAPSFSVLRKVPDVAA